MAPVQALCLNLTEQGGAMDPLVCFQLFLAAVREGNFDAAREHADDFNAWIARGGFPAYCYNGDYIHKLDSERDRYLVTCDSPQGEERWRDVR
jgi:hypothetical protein